MGDDEMNEEFELLKMEAEEMGVKFRSDIGQEKLQERVDAAMADSDVPEEVSDEELEKDDPQLEIVNIDDMVIESDPEVEQDITEGEAWVDRIAMVMLKKGHSQRNVLLRAFEELGVSRGKGTALFTATKGNMRERLVALMG